MTTDRGNARIFTTGSFSDPAKTYTLVVADDSEFSTCTCPAFLYNKRTNGCKHLDELVATFPGTFQRTTEVRGVVDLFRTALDWVGGDVDRAAGLVDAYIAGRDGR